MYKVLFVCLGNICRSPMANAIFSDLIVKNGLQDKISCDSCGTAAYHIGKNADERTLSVLRNNKVEYTHRAKKLSTNLGNDFQLILAMDQQNLEDIKRIIHNSSAVIKIITSFDDGSLYPSIVVDPYYGDKKDFDITYTHLAYLCQLVLQSIMTQLNLTKSQ